MTVMRILLCLFTLSISTVLHASSVQPLETRFGTFSVSESSGPRYTINYQGKSLLSTEALSVRQEGVFRFNGKDILVLRFSQGVNSHEDLMAFLSLNAERTPAASELLRVPANVQAELSQRDETVRLELGVERFTRATAVFDGRTLRLERKGINLSEKKEEPLDEMDCSKLYNSLYLKAFGMSQCDLVRPMIRDAFNDSVIYGAMLKRSRLLNQDQLAIQAEQTCQTRGVTPYNDFKARICGYSTLQHPAPDKNFANVK